MKLDSSSPRGERIIFGEDGLCEPRFQIPSEMPLVEVARHLAMAHPGATSVLNGLLQINPDKFRARARTLSEKDLLGENIWRQYLQCGSVQQFVLFLDTSTVPIL